MFIAMEWTSKESWDTSIDEIPFRVKHLSTWNGRDHNQQIGD